ncbi:hypothetical protein HK099_003955 [Clydaea vesicula]|uniref:Cystinosin-like protein n=1 Tax=Clydaea vesicula TaxID=447962 RepID=A0AAD5U3T2_9FUNG|nr:hypothetical protein HK099_003955 [Clydaea vesicula]
MAVSLVKYTPQAVLNYKLKSTDGWSILNIALDFTGGVLSITQLILDCYITNNWDGIIGNPVKFGLGFISIFFDILFFYQHAAYKFSSKIQELVIVDIESSNDAGVNVIRKSESYISIGSVNENTPLIR